ncbi:MAG: bifunctional riboflavin kinase/FAD synthetase [Neisseriaceae bacterium]|nr:bifunctional riboflavin kinase/FAD synthetase [Neisseriaceae bacterium]
MKIWLGNKLPERTQGSAVTIGNFDGVHLGHRHILQRLKTEAKARQLFSVAMIFEPQPREFFATKSAQLSPFRLSPLRDKLRLFKQTQCVDAVWVQRFNHAFADLSPTQFIQDILLTQLNTQFLLVGDDFRFGKHRNGDFALLQQQNEFVTENTPSILVADARASSTAVRESLAVGRLDLATQMLGHHYTLSGHVKHGAKLGRTFGCPTANVHLPHYRYALSGVFAVEVSGSFGRKRGVASLGLNPTVSQTLQTKLEVHLFDFSGSLYGQRIEVAFLHKLRDEQKFANLDELKQAIMHDINVARMWHTNEA